MRDVVGRGAFTRYFEKGLTADTVDGYLASVEGLRELLLRRTIIVRALSNASLKSRRRYETRNVVARARA